MNQRRAPSTLDWIAVTILLAFVGIWAAILIHTWRSFVPDGAGVIELSAGLTAAAGAITTLIATRTASVLGFTIKHIDEAVDGEKLTPATLSSQLNWATRWAIYAYLMIGVAVVVNWLLLGIQSPEVVAAYALGVLGWLGGAAGVVFGGSKSARAG